MKELKRLDQYRFINKWGTTYLEVTKGWMLSNSIDGDDLIQVQTNNPTFEESIFDLLEIECLV